MDVGLELRQSRERRGISLHQISSTTKISVRVLQAIEASDESRLPAKVFTRSFVKAYAGEMGLDPAETARRYLEQLEPPASETPGTRESIPDTSLQQDTPGRRAARVLRGRFGTATVLLLASVSAFALLVRNYRPDAAEDTGAAIARAAGLAPASAQQSPAAGPAVGTSGTTRGIDILHVAIAPTGPCWVRATVAGQPVLAKLLVAGDRREIDAPSDITLRIGDPTAFAFTINGAPAHLPRVGGQPVTVHLTKENYAAFLKR